MSGKNIGIVKSFNCIEFLSGDGRLSPASDIFFRAHVTNLKLNDIVSFKIVSHWQGKNVESWGVDNIIVLNPNDLPLEIISSCFAALNNENKLAAFEKYFDTLSVEELAAWVADMEKSLSPAEIFHAVTNKKTFNEKIPTFLERSEKKFLWAQYLIDNRELFRLTKLCDDIMIFFMYEKVKRATNLKDLSDLIKLLRDKKDDIKSSPRVKIIYEYICATFAKRYAKQCEADGDVFRRDKYLNLRDKYLDEVDKLFIEIFNGLTKLIEAQAYNPDENFSLPRHIANVLPPCENEKIYCSFCEAVTWSTKNCNFCPRLRFSDISDRFKYCFRINPNINLSAEDWSVIELMEKLDLMPNKDFSKDHPFNREFFTRIGGEFNRIEDLLERLKCRECRHYMRADKKYAKWKTVQDLQKLTSHEHFAAFSSTVFSCRHEGCSQKDKSVYLSYCWLCHAPIDSRDARVKIKGYYLCPNCGAGYRDFGGGQKYALFPATICPNCIRCQNCGGQEFNLQADDEKFLLKCSHCGQTMSAPKTLQDVTSNPKNKHKKYQCSSCGWRIEFNEETLHKKLDPSYEPIQF